MANITLASIRDEAEKKFGNLAIDLAGGETVTLLNPLRLSKESREILSRAADEDADPLETVVARLKAVAKDEALVDRLVAEVDNDLTVIMTIFTHYTEVAQVGEAAASQD